MALQQPITKAVRDTQIITLAQVLDLLEENPTQAKQILKQTYEELRAEDGS
jgi:hypothetical protein